MNLAPLIVVGILTASATVTLAQDTAQDGPAESPAPTIDQIREYVLHARYADAREAATQMRQQTDLAPADRLAVLEVLATIQIAERDEAGASATLAELFSRDPGFRSDPQASPVVVAAFEAARSNPGPLFDVRLEHVPPSSPRPVVRIRVAAGQDAVERVRVSYRQAPSTSGFTEVFAPVGADGFAEAILGVSPGTNVEYHIAAVAPSGAILATLGAESEPLSMSVGAASSGLQGDELPITEAGEDGGVSWWVWAAAGGAAVVVGVVIIVLVASSGSLPDSSLGQGALE